jgi:signal transduction histidine kinase
MTKRLRLLVVEADLVDRLALCRAIEQSSLDASVDEAGDADAAIRLVRAAAYDCLLVEQDLPGTPGVELAALLRREGTLTPIVFVSGRENAEYLLAHAAEGGVTDVIAKHDVSPRKLALRIRLAIRIGRAEAETARAIERAAEAAHGRDEILSMVSHDLRGPLHAISLATEALRDEIEGPAARYLGAIERASARAERMISDLLEANLIDTGGLTLDLGVVDVGAVLRQACADHEVRVKETGGTITAHIPDQPLVVRADRHRVLQVLGNLIGNSLKHAKGTPIDLSVERRDETAVIAVQDRGPGIALQELTHIFDRHRTKRGGLGLVIARGIVAAHGGALAVDSPEGDGTRFYFTLPIVRS